MSSELYKFLKSKQVDAPPYTHTSYIGGKYRIKGEDYEKFNRMYYKALAEYYSSGSDNSGSGSGSGSSEGTKLFMIERLQDTFYFCQDIDNKSGSIKDADIIELINETKLQLVELAESTDEIECIVLKRESNYHLHYNCKTTKEQAQEITTILKERLTEDISSNLDSSPYKNGGMRMLGSYNKDKTDYYRLYDIVKREWISLTYGRFKKTLLEGALASKGKADGKTESVKKGKEEMLSRQNKEIAKEIKQLLEDLKTDDTLKERINGIEKIDKFNLETTKIKHVKNKYTGLSDFYITIKDRFCAFKGREHTRDSDYMYLDLSHKGLVMRCYDVECSRQQFPVDPIKLPLDNADFVKKYNTLTKLLTVKYYTAEVEMTSEIRELVEKSISGTNYSMAKLIFTLYKDKFRVDEMRNTEWYYFNGVRWEKTQKLGILISEEIPKYYKSIKMETEGENGKDLLEYNDLVDKCIYKLESTLFKKNLLQELKIMFYELDKKFAEKLDANVYLLGFENGVYDLEKQHFREGRHDDYITYSTGYDYIEHDDTNLIVKEIYDFFKKLLPKDQVREYTLKVLGRGLIGIPDEKFYMWTGLSGQNGKSTLTKLLENVYGQYAISCDTALLTNKRAGSSNASPDLMEMRGKRAVFFQEPENTDTLKTGLLKQLSGGDTVKARELFKSLVSFVCQAMFIMCCNELPKVNSKGDGGTWRRLRVTEFVSRFVDAPNPSKPYEFKIDLELKQKMTGWLPYVMGILIHYYKKQKAEGIKEPKEVTVATNRYKGDNNEFEEYFESNLKEGGFTSIKDIHEDLLDWWTDNYGQEKAPSIIDLKKVLKIQYGEQVAGKVNGVSVKGFQVSLVNKVEEEEI